MSDQDQNHNLPVEDESVADPVRLPEPIAEAPLLPEEGLGEVGAEQSTSSPPATSLPAVKHSRQGGVGGHRLGESSDSERGGSNEKTIVETEDKETTTEENAVPANVFDNTTPGQWYVLHTYSGYEDAVADSLRQRIDSLDMKDKIFYVLVPKEKQIEIKNGKRKTVEKKIFPGYVLVKMLVTEASWYVVRNTPSVTGFIGSGTIPVPISDAEMETIKKRMIVEEPKHKIDLKLGDLVHIIDGPFKEYDGTVSEVDEARGKIKVLVSIFGRETPVELDFLQVKRA